MEFYSHFMSVLFFGGFAILFNFLHDIFKKRFLFAVSFAFTLLVGVIIINYFAVNLHLVTV
jgi:hypothetical protein